MADQPPSIEDFLTPIVRVLKQLGGTADISDIERHVGRELSIPQEVLKLPHKKDPRSEVSYRQAWARTRLKNVGFIRNPSRSVWSLTEEAQGLSDVDIERLPEIVAQRRNEIRRQDPLRIRTVQESRPRAPKPRYGPRFSPTSQGFEIELHPPSVSERNDPTQISLHRQLIEKINRLKPLINRIANTHPTLLSEFGDYARFVSQDLNQIDVASVWSVGTALQSILESTKRPMPGTMTEPLEPEILGELNSLITLHSGFILGFEVGKELASRAQAFANAGREITETAQETSNVLKPMLSSAGLLAQRARQVIGALDKALEATSYQTALVIQASIDTVTNSLIAYGRVLLPIVAATVPLIDIALKLSGDPNWESVVAALGFLIENRGAIGAFAAHNPELKLWLEWTIERARSFESQRRLM